jgi:hypothetical protein
MGMPEEIKDHVFKTDEYNNVCPHLIGFFSEAELALLDHARIRAQSQ